MRPRRPVAAVLATIIVAGCGGSDPDSSSLSDPDQAATTPASTAVRTPAGPTSTGPTSTGPTSAGTSSAGPTSAAAPPTTIAPSAASTAATSEPPVELAPWQTLPITDVDGTTFTLGDLAGKPVLVETFATWCSNCRAQLGDTNRAAAEVGDSAHVLALSVETDLESGAVADYAVEQGFDNIRFAVMSPEMLAALVDAYGNTVANPPATPKIVIDAAGSAGEMTTGFESPDELVAQVAAAG